MNRPSSLSYTTPDLLRLNLVTELEDARRETDSLFRLIAPESLYERPIPERHRLIFYLGHLEAFDWNLLARNSSGQSSFHPTFDKLFERGIDPEPGSATQDAPADWPSRQEVDSYNYKARNWIDSHINSLDLHLLQMAIEHRHMHAETLAYLLHALDYSQKRVDFAALDSTVRPAPGNPMVEVPAGTAFLGASGQEFAWDNELLGHSLEVPAFRITRFKISHGEYLEFVNDGGPVPHFWTRHGDNWFFRGMFGEIPLPLDWPVWVTWDEASAYAAWRSAKGARVALPTEAQFQRAASLAPADTGRDNFGCERWNPVAVDHGTPGTQGAAAQRLPHQLTGNGWEWTRDVFAPFAGFAPHPFYLGYSADFFDGHHYVMKGASPRTARLLARPSFRNWFRPDYPYMYAGFRLVEAQLVKV